MPKNLVAEAKLEMKASPSHIWTALTDPKQVKQYYFNTDLETDWAVGSPMTFSGEWNDQAYQDLGTVEEFEPERPCPTRTGARCRGPRTRRRTVTS